MPVERFLLLNQNFKKNFSLTLARRKKEGKERSRTFSWETPAEALQEGVGLWRPHRASAAPGASKTHGICSGTRRRRGTATLRGTRAQRCTPGGEAHGAGVARQSLRGTGQPRRHRSSRGTPEPARHTRVASTRAGAAAESAWHGPARHTESARHVGRATSSGLSRWTRHCRDPSSVLEPCTPLAHARFSHPSSSASTAPHLTFSPGSPNFPNTRGRGQRGGGCVCARVLMDYLRVTTTGPPWAPR